MTDKYPDPQNYNGEEGAKPSFLQDVKDALNNACPRCKTPHSVFAGKTDLQPQEICQHCGFALKNHDNGDGPAVFLIFILGFLIVPLALWADYVWTIPLWVHGVFWTGISLVICVLSLRPLKSYIMILQYRHLPRSFGKDDSPDSEDKNNTKN